ncbi:MAG TPA: EhaD family protein [Candidatus Methanoculleus thermohydrogenotrophicum]|nr:EhaD family protein [Candidatus Methanoculleus thermohydrogenotrophicum]NLM82767.1 EhaD family protein [Candidatus Methanoculleus thermohydrogenotrophicum]HOB18028.1 EhaD family protein [Candidatus Methanoculleus thermohydrogenotrophicum]HPZ38146.1 EhaD family protein [Candidatus Methanoculleus thermohydrogenotrophicum]HQC91018.1 EhaD family protein [Candidatus Methanoculleus thermohydrogenotrophicum]
MDDPLVVLFAAVAIIGAVSAHLQHDRFNKLIAVGITFGGIVPFIVDRGYLDVAIAISLIIPITTIIMLLICRRETCDT